MQDHQREIDQAVDELKLIASQVEQSGNDPGSPWAFGVQARIAAQTAVVNAHVARGTARMATWTTILALATVVLAIATVVLVMADVT